MYWDDDLTLLAVGLENGVIHLLRIASEHEYEECDEFCVVKQHAATVTGVALIKSTATLISISQDKNLMLTNISDNDPERPSCRTITYYVDIISPNPRETSYASIGQDGV